MTLTRDDVLAAQARIDGRVRHTPLLAPATGAPSQVWLKLEHLQHCGVFKTRGAFNRQLAARERGELGEAGVVVASGGNAGLAQAFAARELGIRATVFVPETAPAVKIARIEGYGALVRRSGREYAEAYGAATAFADVQGATFAHAYDQPDVAAGAGTLAEEILDDEPTIDTIVVAVGGGGLYAGIAAAVRGRARVVAVEPVLAPTLHRAIAAGRPVDVEVSGVAADSLGARRIGDLAFEAALADAPVSVLVDEDDIVAARQRLWDDFRVASEHGAATTYAALLSGAYVPSSGERVAVVVCGANTDPATLI
ncbi:threonine/serine dehydratase [Nocardioides hwasunensis]|uniref:Threonine/serine dehydratase n=1 Tax=Nocardioides hwasunensis TaxID=397258 RepID=A0ABR8MI48_9ACTN|nr:threonine/serine dehydratase [Nocardioides hwasunensis]MBD3914385.1 threonine/serine dehydratase [Nocardioides hwasunensis]